MRILILSDGISVHFNQSLRIVKILSEEIKIDYEIIESKLKYKLLRSFLMQLQKLLSMNFLPTKGLGLLMVNGLKATGLNSITLQQTR